MRLDVFLADNAYYKSRTRAVGAIKAGCVFVGGKAVDERAFSDVRYADDHRAYRARHALFLVATQLFGAKTARRGRDLI